MHLVIPMAGRGSRFADAGYAISKPFLPIGPWKMFEIVLSNLWSNRIQLVTLVAQKSAGLGPTLEVLGRQLNTPIRLIEVDIITEGPASSAYLAAKDSPRDLPLVIANSDQYIDADLDPFFSAANTGDGMGAILTMSDDDPKWSYVETDEQGRVKRVVEKQVVSNIATAGLYGFAKTSYFLDAYTRMVQVGDTTNGEYYVGPSYNHLDNLGQVYIVSLGEVGEVMHGLGVPEDYEGFLVNQSVKDKAVAGANLLFGE